MDAFTIMRIAGHSSVTVSQRYVHPTPEALERAFEKLEALNGAYRQEVGIILGTVESATERQIPANIMN